MVKRTTRRKSYTMYVPSFVWKEKKKAKEAREQIRLWLQSHGLKAPKPLVTARRIGAFIALKAMVDKGILTAAETQLALKNIKKVAEFLEGTYGAITTAEKVFTDNLREQDIIKNNLYGIAGYFVKGSPRKPLKIERKSLEAGVTLLIKRKEIKVGPIKLKIPNIRGAEAYAYMLYPIVAEAYMWEYLTRADLPSQLKQHILSKMGDIQKTLQEKINEALGIERTQTRQTSTQRRGTQGRTGQTGASQRTQAGARRTGQTSTQERTSQTEAR